MQYSIVQKKELDKIVLRFDAEYYHPDFINLQNRINNLETGTIRALGSKLDCSAFYPSIVPYYDFEGNGVPFLRVNEIQNGLLNISENTAFLPELILNQNKNTIAKGYFGDLIIAKGGNTLAKVALLTNEYKEYSICRDLIILRSNKLRLINKYFLWMFLHSNIGQNLLLRTASQTGQPHLTIEAINEISIPLFSENFQQLFELLYNESTALKNKSLLLYEASKALLLSELKLNSWKPKHELSFIKNYSEIKEVERLDAEYFQPKYDDIVKAIKTNKNGFDTLGNIATIKKCIEVGANEYLEEGIPFIRVSNISPFEITNEKYISEDLYKGIVSHQPKKGEILLSKDATPGIAYYIDKTPDKMIPSGGILRLKLKNAKILPEYLVLVLNSLIVKEQINRDVGGSVILHWRPDQVGNTLIPILSEEKQAEIQGKIVEATSLRKKSKQLLEIAKKGVEIAIEKDETTAKKWIKEQCRSYGVNL